jgi:hypothetical protein
LYIKLNEICLDYPWAKEQKIDGWPQLRRWLFLPDYTTPPLATQLIGNLSLSLLFQ